MTTRAVSVEGFGAKERDRRARGTGAAVVRNEEQAGHELQVQDAERECALEQEHQQVLEQERTAERARRATHERWCLDLRAP